ncbi:hypothetical protein R84B8_01886 [Treponema sp. R8-4-B8]
MTVKRIISLFGIIAFAAMLIFALAGCEETKVSLITPETPPPSGTVINIAAIKGVIVPAYGLTPITSITENEQYRGAVTWNDNPSTFGALTSYTAIITLTAKDGFTLEGVAANFFTVVGATSVSNAANSGVITAIFPATDSRLVNSIEIKTQPNKLTYTHEDTLDLAGLVITLTYDNGTRVEVIAENFPIKSITTEPEQGDILYYVTNNDKPIKIKYGSLTCNTNNLSIIFPTFTTIADLETYLQSKPANTADNPYIVVLNVNDISTLKTTLDRASKYVYLDLSGSTINNIPNSVFSSYSYSYSSDYISLYYRGTPTLTGITIPDSVTSIGYTVFSGCNDLTSITVASGNTVYRSEGNCVIQINDNKLILGIKTSIIPNNVTSIGNSAFTGCTGLTSITIPDSVTSIGGLAFAYCNDLTSITIPNSVTSIGNSAFTDCTGLTSITIPNNVTSIGNPAFTGCTGLTSITVASGNTVYRSEGNCLIQISDNKLIQGIKTSIIPDSVTSIDNEAFFGCSGLTSVTIPNGVTIIGDSAFYGCSGLTSVTIPDSVTIIRREAFSRCSGLTSITVASDNSVYRSEGNCLIQISNNILILGIKTSVIPDNVTSIGNSAFTGCTGLTSVTIPDSVTSIGNSAFYGCTGLTSVTFQGTITSANFITDAFNIGDLRDKYLAGGIGTYTRSNTGYFGTWTKQ